MPHYRQKTIKYSTTDIVQVGVSMRYSKHVQVHLSIVIYEKFEYQID